MSSRTPSLKAPSQRCRCAVDRGFLGLSERDRDDALDVTQVLTLVAKGLTLDGEVVQLAQQVFAFGPHCGAVSIRMRTVSPIAVRGRGVRIQTEVFDLALDALCERFGGRARGGPQGEHEREHDNHDVNCHTARTPGPPRRGTVCTVRPVGNTVVR